MPAPVTQRRPRRFEFERDSFAFANELHWEYHFDHSTGKTTFRQRDPKPAYAHRCFVLTRAARQFLYHARFDQTHAPATGSACRRLVREIMSRNPRVPCRPEDEVLFPGYACLREFSRVQEDLLKAECGGAWRSYVLRSHWRMVFPISRTHQKRTAASLLHEIQWGGSPIVHLVRFPQLTINHGMVLFDAKPADHGTVFLAYDPNDPARPSEITFDSATQTFSLPSNRYWIGGMLNVIEIYRNWWM